MPDTQAQFSNRPAAENVLIVLALAAGVAILGAAWAFGDATEVARGRQWQLAFLGFAALLAGQWIVAASPASRLQQIAGSAAALALAGLGVEAYYDISWAPSTPFIASFAFVFLASESAAFIGRNGRLARGASAYIRLAAVAWNCAFGLVNLNAAYMQLPDVVNLFIAFSWLWTAASAVLAASELIRIAEHAPSRETGSLHGGMIGRGA